MARKELLDPLEAPEPGTETGPGSRFSWTTASTTSYPTPPVSGHLPQYPGEQSIRSPERLSKKMTGDSAASTASKASSNTNPFRKSVSENGDSRIPIQSTQGRQTNTNSSRDSNNNSRKSNSSNNPFLPSPPASASPRRNRFHSAGNTSDLLRPPAAAVQSSRLKSNGYGRSSSIDNSNGNGNGNGNISGHRRAVSLSERFPGDTSHRPLAIIRRDSRAARRAPHLTRKHLPGPDQVDRLDHVLTRYHHEGPYDAALMSRNRSPKLSPLVAVRDSNEEAIKATPEENIRDAVMRHRPLDGTAVIPPGVPDKFGRVYHYEEGADLMREVGAEYMRWPGVTYLPEDLKGKGEPSFSIDRGLKEHKNRNRPALDGRRSGDIELVSRPRRGTDTDYGLAYSTSRAVHGGMHGASARDIDKTGKFTDVEQTMTRRRNSTGGRKLSDGFRRKFSGLVKRRDSREK